MRAPEGETSRLPPTGDKDEVEVTAPSTWLNAPQPARSLHFAQFCGLVK